MARDHLPSMASFMGMPVEIRLHIYQYLLTSCHSSEEIQTIWTSGHCCLSNPTKLRNGKGYPMACHCSNGQSLHATILRVNKQVFDEAMPVLYDNMELQVYLPNHATQSLMTTPLHQSISYLPSYGLSRITNAVLIGENYEFFTAGWTVLIDPLPYYTKILASTFPRLKRLRLHIDYRRGRPTIGDDMLLFRALPALINMPGIQAVTIHCHRCSRLSRTWHSDRDKDMVETARKLKAETQLDLSLTWVKPEKFGG